MRLIDADQIKIPHKRDDIYYRNTYSSGVTAMVHAIGKTPTIEAEPVVHGRWIGIQYDGYADGCPVYDTWECSECREEYENEGDPPYFNYCPNCGAKMARGDQNE